MTKKLLYQFSLALPVLVPLLFLPFLSYVRSMNEVAAGTVMVILYSGYVGGLPYLLLVIPLLIWMRNESDREIRKALLLSPLLMLIPLAICYAVYQFVISPALTFWDTTKMFTTFFIFFGICTLVFGYFYVGITLGAASLVTTESKEVTSH